MIPLEGLKEYMRKEQDVFAHARFLVFEKLIQNIVQIGASLLDACVLAVLDRRDVYGYELTVNIKSIIEISESTLYPVLRRLQKEGYVVTYDQPYNGQNRRYYSITDSGREKLLAYRQDWQEYKTNVDRMMKGDVEYE